VRTATDCAGLHILIQQLVGRIVTVIKAGDVPCGGGKTMNLPRLLAGPILRRAEAERVCIWLATSEKMDMRAKIYVLRDKGPSETRAPAILDDMECIGSSSPEPGRPETVALGERLSVSLLSVRRPKQEKFPLNRLLFYDITLGQDSLASLGLTRGERSLCYTGMSLPCFFLTDRLRSFLHGSCRKPHGLQAREQLYRLPKEEERDALATVDDVIAASVGDLRTRPALLFLTGDQIYADDVAGPLIGHLNRLGQAITGWREDIPSVAVNPAITAPYGRTRILEEAGAGFTSGHRGNHLLTFGEFAAVYLLVWIDDPALWPQETPKPDDTLGEEENALFREEWDAVMRFRKSLLLEYPSLLIPMNGFGDTELSTAESVSK
jgi:hypothetical protein